MSIDLGEAIICKACGGPSTISSPCRCNGSTVYKHEPKEDCPGRSQHRCKYCGECHSVFAICSSHPSYNPGIIPDNSKECTIESLYNELGSLKWIGADEGWNEAIEAVRKHIQRNIK